MFSLSLFFYSQLSKTDLTCSGVHQQKNIDVDWAASVLILDVSESTLSTSIIPLGYIYMRSPRSSLNKSLSAHVAEAH